MTHRHDPEPGAAVRPPYGSNVELPAGSAEERQAAWERLCEFMLDPPPPGPGACAPGDYGTRAEWYDDESVQ